VIARRVEGLAPGTDNHVGHPVTPDEQRFGPFHRQYPGPVAGAGCDGVTAPVEGRDQFFAAGRHAGGLRHPSDVMQQAAEVAPVQRQHCGIADGVGGQAGGRCGTDVAERLRKNQIRMQCLQGAGVGLKKRGATGQSVADLAVNRRRVGLVGIQRGQADPRAVHERRWLVALRGNPHQLIPQTQSGDDFGGTGKQRNDALAHGKPTLASPALA